MTIGNAPLTGSTIGLLGAGKISTIQDELFVAGKSFSYEDYLTFGTDEVKNIIFDSSAFTGINLIFNPITFAAPAGPITIEFYTGTTSDEDGTVLQSSNRREGQPPAQSVIRVGDTNISLGTRFSGDLVPATGTGIGNTNPGSNQPGLPFEIDASVNHAIVITNTDGADVLVQIKMTWFEV